MCDPIRSGHLLNLTETDVETLAQLVERRPHPTPREQRLALALRQLERGHTRRLKLKAKAGTR